MSYESSIIDRPADVEAPAVETPVQLAEMHRTNIGVMLADSEALALRTEYGKPLATELELLLQAGLTAHEAKELSDDQLSDIGELGLSALTALNNDRDSRRDGIRFVGGASGFEGVVDGLNTLFGCTEDSHPPTVEQDVQRTTTLLRFTSKSRDSIHEKFVDKYLDKLTADDGGTIPELEAIWQNPDFLAAMGTRFGKNISNGSRKSWPDNEQRLFTKTFEAFGFSETEKKDILNAVNSYSDRGGEVATN